MMERLKTMLLPENYPYQTQKSFTEYSDKPHGDGRGKLT